MKKYIFVFIFMFFLIGCRECHKASQYELVNTSDGKLYRLNKVTGEVAIVTPKGISIISESKDIKIGDKILGGIVTKIENVEYKNGDGSH